MFSLLPKVLPAALAACLISAPVGAATVTQVIDFNDGPLVAVSSVNEGNVTISSRFGMMIADEVHGATGMTGPTDYFLAMANTGGASLVIEFAKPVDKVSFNLVTGYWPDSRSHGFGVLGIGASEDEATFSAFYDFLPQDAALWKSFSFNGAGTTTLYLDYFSPSGIVAPWAIDNVSVTYDDGVVVDAAVPLPAALPLLFAGVGGLAMVRGGKGRKG